MKNLFKGVLVIMLISIAPTLQAKDLVNPLNARRTAPTAAETEVMVKRLEEIKAMDISNMSQKEKRALRKEVRETQKKVQATGVYISVGVLLLIILIIILLV